MLPNTLVFPGLYISISEQSLLWLCQKWAIIFVSQPLCLPMHPTMTQCSVWLDIMYTVQHYTLEWLEKRWLHSADVELTNGSLPSQRPFLLHIHSHGSFSPLDRMLRGILADESYILINLPPPTYASQSSSPLSWALGSKQEVTPPLLQHSSYEHWPLLALHKTTWRQNSAIRFKPLREMRCNCY